MLYNMKMRKNGFTLIETLIVVTMIGILVAIIIPQYKYHVLRTKEAVLKENLFQIRDCINKYYFDKKKYPTDLADLVTNRYLARIPDDPFLHKPEYELVYLESDPEEEFDPDEVRGIIDIKSLAPGAAIDGSQYHDW